MDKKTFEALKRLIAEAEEQHFQEGDELADDVELVSAWMDEVEKEVE